MIVTQRVCARDVSKTNFGAMEIVRGILEKSSSLALQYLFPHWCRLPFSRMHRESLKRYDDLCRQAKTTRRKGTRLVLIAPRGHAKSALHATLLPLLDMCFGREHFIVLVSATQAQAEGRLRAIRNEITKNEMIKLAFPQMLAVAENNRRSLVAGEVRVSAFGAGCEIRGIGHATARPSKIILDDVEDSYRIYSGRYRDELFTWFQEVVEPLGDSTTHIEIVGTLLHADSLLARLSKRPDVEVRRYCAVETWAKNDELWQQWRSIFTNMEDSHRLLRARKFYEQHEPMLLEGTAVLWPEKESYLQLMEEMVVMGRPAFYKEKQNIPPAGEGSMFFPESWQRFVLRKDGSLLIVPKDGHSLHTVVRSGDRGNGSVSLEDPNDSMRERAAAPSNRSTDAILSGQRKPQRGESLLSSTHVTLEQLTIVGYLDPSLGRGDWAAIATVGKDVATGTCYVLDLWVGRTPPAAQVAKAFELHRRWRYHVFGYEAVGFQQMLEQAFAEENKRWCAEGKILRPLEVRAMKSKEPKIARIAALEPLTASGEIRFALGLPEELEIEARAFPSGRHDDALDALAGAITLARGTHAGQRIHTITLEKRSLRRL